MSMVAIVFSLYVFPFPGSSTCQVLWLFSMLTTAATKTSKYICLKKMKASKKTNTNKKKKNNYQHLILRYS